METTRYTQTSIVFDFGGVLMDWNPHYLYDGLLNGDRAAVDRFLCEVDFYAWNLIQDKGRPFSVAVSELSQRFPQYAALIRAFDDRWEETLKGPIPETVNILQGLKENGLPLFALSNWSVEKFQLIRPRFTFLDWFQKIVLSGEARMAKPDECFFTYFLEKTGLKAEGCLFIDDSPVNIAAGIRMGFRTILFESPQQLETDLRRLGLLNGNQPA